MLTKTLLILLFVLAWSETAAGMEFGWDKEQPLAWHLFIKGEINKGDYERFRNFIKRDFDSYVSSARYVKLSSSGGDVVEALKLASLLKKLYVTVYVRGDDRCASACFLLFVAASSRFVDRADEIGIHRAYFSSDYFANLRPSQAEQRHKELEETLRVFLRDNSVPTDLMERMNRTSSEEIYWLTETDLDRIGIRPPWYEQLLIARCGLDIALENKLLAPGTHSQDDWEAYKKNTSKVLNCESNLIEPDLADLRKELFKN